MNAGSRMFLASMVSLGFGLAVAAQQAPSGPTASTTDPRYTLKPGLRDAGEAAKNLERLAAMIEDTADAAREKHEQLLGAELVVRQSCGARDLLVSTAVA